MESNKKTYHVITDEYLKIQESLGIKDPLIKFTEWRLYIEFFGKRLSPKDQKTIHEIAEKLVSELPEKYHEALLTWISWDLISGTISEALNAMLRHFLLGMVGLSSRIFDAPDMYDIQAKDDIDFAIENVLCANIPDLEEIQSVEDNIIDVRLIELLEFQTHGFWNCPQLCYVQTLNSARKTHVYILENTEVEQFIPYFINDNGYDRIVFRNYKFIDFINRFYEEGDNWRKLYFGLIGTYIDYVKYDFRDDFVEYMLGKKPRVQ